MKITLICFPILKFFYGSFNFSHTCTCEVFVKIESGIVTVFNCTHVHKKLLNTKQHNFYNAIN